MLYLFYFCICFVFFFVCFVAGLSSSLFCVCLFLFRSFSVVSVFSLSVLSFFSSYQSCFYNFSILFRLLWLTIHLFSLYFHCFFLHYWISSLFFVSLRFIIYLFICLSVLCSIHLYHYCSVWFHYGVLLSNYLAVHLFVYPFFFLATVSFHLPLCLSRIKTVYLLRVTIPPLSSPCIISIRGHQSVNPSSASLLHPLISIGLPICPCISQFASYLLIFIMLYLFLFIFCSSTNLYLPMYIYLCWSIYMCTSIYVDVYVYLSVCLCCVSVVYLPNCVTVVFLVVCLSVWLLCIHC